MPINKKRNLNNKSEKMDVSSSESDSNSDNETNPDVYTGNEEIQVDFEGRNPTDSDLDGIQQLLHQLFLKAHINITEMANLIIEQNYIGSVITQSEIDDESEDDEDDELYDSNVIFGVTSVINITHKKDMNCIKQLKSYIIEKSKNNLPNDTKTQLQNILEDNNNSVGFIVNERFINIPAQISIPLFENLCKEIKRANEKRMNYNFDYYIMFIKFYRNESKKNKPAEDIYSNLEEEVICKESMINFEYSVETESDTGISGNWLENDSSLIPYRKVVLFKANRLEEIVKSIKEFVNE